MQIKNRFSLIVIFSVVFIIGLLNFGFNTYLTGWDNLHPEYNLLVNIRRSIFAAWQEYQGLGLLGGMGHAADLPRQLVLLFTSLFLPANLLRQIYFFLMLLLGPLGIYFLLEKVFLVNLNIERRKIASLAGALFYLLNLATVQTFYAPFDAFVTHFAFLPWLFLASFLLFQNLNRKTLALFLTVNIAALPQAYVPTIFFVYFSALTAGLFLFSIKTFKQNLGRILQIVALTLAINAFWLLPFLFFTAKNTQVNIDSKINQMVTEKNLQQNKRFGDLLNVASLRGFWFEYTDLNSDGNFAYMLSPWRDHFKKPLVSEASYLLFSIVVLGIFAAFRKKNQYRFTALFLFLFSFTLLANNTPPFSWFDSLLYKWPFFAQIFRAPFTKFSVMAGFAYAIFFAFGIAFVSNLLSKIPTHSRVYGKIPIITCVGLMFFVAFPVFRGQLFYTRERLKIPNEYFQVFDFFQSQDKNTRIANFPQPNFWGWTFYRWGYSGSGFLWYGIEQPILDRAFDVWNDKDENYYWEISYALYSKNPNLFEAVLEKYQINWLLTDGNVINPTSSKAIYTDELEQLLSDSQKVTLTQSFGKIDIYKVNLDSPTRNFAFLAENLPSVRPEYKWNNYDRAYQDNGNYVSIIHNSEFIIHNSIYYPFRSLFTGKQQDELEFAVEDKGKTFLFTKPLPESTVGYVLEIPEFNKEELTWVNPDDLSQIRYFKPEVTVENGILKVWVPKVDGYFSAKVDPANDTLVQEAKNCNQLNQAGKVENEIISDGGQAFLRLTAQEATNCSASFWLPNLPHSLSYLVTVQSQNISGKSLLFWLENLTARKADIETYVTGNTQHVTRNTPISTSYYIQPPMESDGLGYTLHFDNISIGNKKVINDLGEVTVNPIPYKFLSEIKLVNSQFDGSQPVILRPAESSHLNPSLYKIKLPELENEQTQTLVLSQAFDPGWVAYEFQKSESRIQNFLKTYFPFVGGKKIENHVLVNNWENGWQIDKSEIINNQSSIILVFWPQYLEYLGFTLLIIPLLLLLKNKK